MVLNIASKNTTKIGLFFGFVQKFKQKKLVKYIYTKNTNAWKTDGLVSKASEAHFFHKKGYLINFTC